MQSAGYLSAEYAESLREFGDPVRLPRSGGWILRRRIPGTGFDDAMGIYPFMSCSDWTGLADDVADLARRDFVSLTLVTDPFSTLDSRSLSTIFPDRMIHFKNHHVNDLEDAGLGAVSSRNLRYARRASDSVSIECVPHPPSVVEEWIALYDHLIRRHEITDLRAFSPDSHRAQATVPGAVYMRAAIDGEAVGMHIWYVQDGVAHSHLTALNDRGYDVRAAYALKAEAIRTFTGEVKWLNNAGGGGGPEANDGLTRFKRRWSSSTRPSYLCGRIFDETAYRALTTAAGAENSTYFPAYRTGEFG